MVDSGHSMNTLNQSHVIRVQTDRTDVEETEVSQQRNSTTMVLAFGSLPEHIFQTSVFIVFGIQTGAIKGLGHYSHSSVPGKNNCQSFCSIFIWNLRVE